MLQNLSLDDRFEAHRPHLRSVAYRMLGSLCDAEDAVQECWMRFHGADTSKVQNLGGWLTTVVARICLDMLRARTSRSEEPLAETAFERAEVPAGGFDAERELLLAESVGLALLVVLERLAPAERVAFVLHDAFGVPFDDIAAILDRSPAATRQLASRARHRVRGGNVGERGVYAGASREQQQRIVGAYLAASRDGDFEALIGLLDPDVVLDVDAVLVPAGASPQVRSARRVAGQALAFSSRGRHARPILVNGTVGVAVAPIGRLLAVLRFTIDGGRIVALDLIADPARLRALDLAVLQG